MADSETWDQRYLEASPGGDPLQVLKDHSRLLPERGLALDLACGVGANAIFLAQRGLNVSAWDFSAVAIEKLQRKAALDGLDIKAQVRNLVAEPPAPQSFNVIVVGRFLQREIVPQISTALRPGGVLFYQTFSRCAGLNRGPSNPDYRLAVNELLDLFSDLQVRFYLEGTDADAAMTESMLVATKGHL